MIFVLKYDITKKFISLHIDLGVPQTNRKWGNLWKSLIFKYDCYYNIKLMNIILRIYMCNIKLKYDILFL